LLCSVNVLPFAACVYPNGRPVLTCAGFAAGEVRASDAEREAVVERLRVATVEGRLTLGELTERTEAASTATTRGELVPITADLPAASGSPEPLGRRPAVATASGSSLSWVTASGRDDGGSKRQGGGQGHGRHG
jgi:hypothetical protein